MEKDSAGTRQGTGGLEAGWRRPAPSLPVGRFQSPSPPHAETGGGLCTWKPASFSHADTAGSGSQRTWLWPKDTPQDKAAKHVTTP